MANWSWISGPGLWNDPNNWQEDETFGPGVPAAGDFVLISDGDVTNNAVAAARDIRIRNSSNLTTSGSLIVSDKIEFFAASAIATLAVTGGTVTAPLISINNARLTVSGGGTVTGAITVSTGAVIIGGTSPASAGTINGTIALGDGSGSLTFRTTNDAAFGGNISGVGSILVDSAGRTTTLTGDNSGHSGLTTINATNRLQIGDGFSAAGTYGGGAITNNGSLAFAYGSGFAIRTLNNDISGTGDVSFSGNVDFSLTGSNSYSGQTLIENNAQLIVGNGGTTGNLGTGAVVNNAVLSFNHAAGNYYHNNAISGVGSLVVRGSGAEYLTGSNSYSGLTIVQSGTLVVGAGGTDGTLGTGNVILHNGAQLDLFRSDTQLIANNILGDTPGDGTLRVFLNRTAILTGTNSYGATYIAAGSTLQIGNGGTSGTLGTGAVTNDGTLVFNHGFDPLFGPWIYGNAIGGSGGVTVNSDDGEYLAGVNSYTGVTTINSGVLALQDGGSISNSASITLNGTGRFEISNISGASASVRDIFMTAAGTSITMSGQTLIVTHADLYAGPGRFRGSVLNDAVVFNVVSASYTLAGATTGAVFSDWTDGQDSITINGNASANTLTGDEMQATTINGGAGNDRIEIRNGGGNYDGGADIDTLAVGSSMALTGTLAQFEAIELSAGANLTMTGSQFRNGLATNTALSGTGTITVNMSAGVNFLASGMGFASTVATVVNGTSGIDIIKLGLGASTGNTINSGDGVDQIRGSNGVDTINGGIGNDKIMGIGGADVLTGGTGNDQFRYFQQSDSGLGAAADRVTDFTIGGDKLSFLLIDADAVAAGDQAFNFVGTAAFANTGVGQIRYQNSGADLLVQADVNGDGVADMEIILQGQAGGTLTAGDFIL